MQRPLLEKRVPLDGTLDDNQVREHSLETLVPLSPTEGLITMAWVCGADFGWAWIQAGLS